MLSGVYPVPLQRFAQGGGFRGARCRLRNHHQIQSAKGILRAPKTFPHATLDPVADHRLGRYPARDRQAKARMSERVGTGVHTEEAIADAASRAADFAQLETGSQTPALR